MQSIAEIDWESLRQNRFHPSPTAWEDQTIYFLLADRFSDGNEDGYRDNSGEDSIAGTTPLFDADRDWENTVATPEGEAEWRRAGGTWRGGNLRGLATKLGYLKRLGVTTLWVSPLLKQCAHDPYCYHGYGTQNFLEIDPHFGTRDDLRALTATAHSLGMFVLLDIIVNHTGDVFAYADEGPLPWRESGEPYPVAGFRDANGTPSLPFAPVDSEAYPEGAVWPRELQNPECFTRKGRIVAWDRHPEYLEGDFFTFKDLNLGSGTGDDFQPSPALLALVDAYKYWIAFADLDGFRLDTVKHMTPESVAYFAREIHAFAESLGKRNFYLIGEIVGDRAFAARTLIASGLNAALGVGEVPQLIRGIIAGERSPADYFSIFANSRREGEARPDPVWWRDRVITFFDDHDQVGKTEKGRLAHEAGSDRAQAERAILRATAFQMFTLGIPCLYYGTEQGLDGHAPPDVTDPPDGKPRPDDIYVRETLFGGGFGPFRSQGRHVFTETTYLYTEIARMLSLRQQCATLRRGRQYLREISLEGRKFLDSDAGRRAVPGRRRLVPPARCG